MFILDEQDLESLLQYAYGGPSGKPSPVVKRTVSEWLQSTGLSTDLEPVKSGGEIIMGVGETLHPNPAVERVKRLFAEIYNIIAPLENRGSTFLDLKAFVAGTLLSTKLIVVNLITWKSK